MAQYFIPGPGPGTDRNVATFGVVPLGYWAITPNGGQPNYEFHEVVPFELYLESFIDDGEFGEPPPNNARIKYEFELFGAFPFSTYAVDPPGLAELSFTVLGGFSTDANIDQNVTTLLLAPVNGLRSDVFIQGPNARVVLAFLALGQLRLELFPALERDVFVEILGYRPILPPLVQPAALTHVSELIDEGTSTYQIDTDTLFRVSDAFVFQPGEPLSDLGARRGYLGMVREVTDMSGTRRVVRFRAPEVNECVYDSAGVVTRWDGERWTTYSTLPQRALARMQVFDIFDQSGIYDYYARILGMMLCQLGYDSARLLDFLDPTRCPAQFLPLLGDTFGASIDDGLPTDEQRESIRTWTPLQKIKGLPNSIVIALRLRKILGYATHVWVLPGSTGANPGDYLERPFGYDFLPPTTYFPASQVVIHINNPDGTPILATTLAEREELASYLQLNALPAHVQIRYFTTDVPATQIGNVSPAYDMCEVVDGLDVTVGVEAGVLDVEVDDSDVDIFGLRVPQGDVEVQTQGSSGSGTGVRYSTAVADVEADPSTTTIGAELGLATGDGDVQAGPALTFALAQKRMHVDLDAQSDESTTTIAVSLGAIAGDAPLVSGASTVRVVGDDGKVHAYADVESDTSTTTIIGGLIM